MYPHKCVSAIESLGLTVHLSIHPLSLTFDPLTSLVSQEMTAHNLKPQEHTENLPDPNHPNQIGKERDVSLQNGTLTIKSTRNGNLKLEVILITIVWLSLIDYRILSC